MSSYHALEGSVKQHEVRIAFHLPIPDQNNSAGVNLRTAVKQCYSQQSSQVPWLETDFAAELANIQDGVIYERVETVCFDADMTTLAKRGVLDARYNELKTWAQNNLPKILEWWGLNRDIA